MPPRPQPTPAQRPRFTTIVAVLWLLVGLFQIIQAVQLLPTLFGDEPMARSQFEHFFGPHHDFDAVLAQSPGLYGWRALWAFLAPGFLVVAGLAWRGGFELLGQRRRALLWLTTAGAMATVLILVPWVASSAILAKIAHAGIDADIPAEVDGVWSAVGWVNASSDTHCRAPGRRPVSRTGPRPPARSRPRPRSRSRQLRPLTFRTWLLFSRRSRITVARTSRRIAIDW